jgi:hypothetical protein
LYKYRNQPIREIGDEDIVQQRQGPEKIFFRSLQNLTGKDNTYLQIDNASFGGLLLTVLSKKLNNNSKKKNIFLSIPTPFFHSIPFLPHLLHPTIFLHSVFLPVPFSPSLSFSYIHSTVLNSLSLSHSS